MSVGLSFSTRLGKASSEGSSVFGRAAATSGARGGGGSTIRSGGRAGSGGRAVFGGAFSSTLGAAGAVFSSTLGAAAGGRGSRARTVGAGCSGVPSDGVAGTRLTMYTFD